MNHMIDLDENCLDQIAQAAAPLSPLDREAFIDAAIRLLKQEPIFGPGTVNRIVRELLGTGVYRRDAITGVGRPMRGPHVARQPSSAPVVPIDVPTFAPTPT